MMQASLSTPIPLTNLPHLTDTARALLAPGKGLLAMDESNRTCNERFATADIPQTVEMRRAWRELLLTAPRLSECISGVILYDETIRQHHRDGRPFPQVARDAGLLVGIKVDSGAVPLAGHTGETVTEGLDGLRARLTAYAHQGARFAKWRAVFSLDGAVGLPSPASLSANAHALARYAALCQEAGIVPVVEPEVLMTGPHTIAQCQAATEAVLHSVFDEMNRQGVLLEALILKPNMVVPGLSCLQQSTADEVADATLQCLLRSVPAAVPGITVLSGGQTGVAASRHLQALHVRRDASGSAHHSGLPWTLSFSFARALQHPAMERWAGQDANRAAAQAALLHRARCNSAAVRGAYSAAMETSPAAAT